jgi:DNA-binding MarR family transcriptional regulator
MSDLEARTIELKKSFDVIVSHFKSLSTTTSSDELNLQELKILDFIGQHESCIMREVAEHLKVAVSTMTGVIDKLEDKGFVKRERNDEDRRIVRVMLTAKGQKIYQSFVESHIELSRRMLQSLEENEQEKYLELTKKIAKGAAHFIAANSVK